MTPLTRKIAPPAEDQLETKLQVSHLLVDLDGTLVGAKDLPVTIDFLKHILPKMRKHGTWFKVLCAISAMREELKLPSEKLNNNERATQAFSKSMGITLKEADDFLTQTVSHQFPLLESHFYPIPGAKEFLTWAKDHYPLILATNPVWKEEIVKLRIRWADLDATVFRSITHSEKMHACKPLPEYYREILVQEGLSHTECLLVGNDPKQDLPATLVGIPVFILTGAKTRVSLKLKGQKAPAWAGSFKHLKQLLQA